MRSFVCGVWFWSCAVASAQTPPPKPLPPVIPVSGRDVEPTRPAVDLAQLTPAARQAHLAGQRGAEWLVRAQKPDGRFVAGWLVALNQPADGVSTFDQIEAARALAKAASLFREERYAVRARQAVLTLLLETAADPADPRSRSTALPSNVVNRLGASAGIALAITDVSATDAELLDQADQLVRFVVRRQSADGSFLATDQPDDPAPPATARYQALAFAALIQSQAVRPAPWKMEAIQKAIDHYAAACRGDGELPAEPLFVAAFAAAGRLGPDRSKAAVEAAIQLADRLVARQIDETETRHPEYRGGFRLPGERPRLDSAAAVAALAEAAGLMRQLPDAARHARYRSAAERGALFLATLQFSESRCQHFIAGYRPVVVGGFHASSIEGDVTTAGTAAATRALIDVLRGAG